MNRNSPKPAGRGHIACWLLLLALPLAQAAPRYEVTVLLPQKGDRTSVTWGSQSLNDWGATTGTSGPFPTRKATAWWPNGKPIPMKGGPGTFARGAAINNIGTVAGTIDIDASDDPTDFASMRAARWDIALSKPRQVLRGAFDWGAYSDVYGINNRGWIVGLVYDNPGSPTADSPFRPFVQQGNGRTYIIDRPVDSGMELLAIDDGNRAVGYVFDFQTGLPQAVTWTASKGLRVLENEAFALATSRDGRYVAGGTLDNAAIWNSLGARTDLPDLPGLEGIVFSEAVAVNRRGDALGFALVIEPDGEEKQVWILWKDGRAYEINSRLAKPVDLEIGGLRAINDRGQILASGITPEFRTVAVLLDPVSH